MASVRLKLRRAGSEASRHHGSRSRASYGLVVLLAVLASMSFSRSPLAQETAPGTDSLSQDSVRVDSTRADSNRWRAGNYKGPHGMQAALYALVIAPSQLVELLDSTPQSTPSRLAYWQNHVSIYVTNGLSIPYDTGIANEWSGSAVVEVVRHGYTAEARVEQVRVPDFLEYSLVRIGRLSHPAPNIAAGVTLGYRHARGLSRHSGIELGFPFVAGGRKSWVRLEAAYVFSLKQTSWNYRFEWERLLGRGPVFTGVNIDLKSWEIRNHGVPSHGTIGVLLGMVFGDFGPR